MKTSKKIGKYLRHYILKEIHDSQKELPRKNPEVQKSVNQSGLGMARVSSLILELKVETPDHIQTAHFTT